jgi:hypothetical protein
VFIQFFGIVTFVMIYFYNILVSLIFLFYTVYNMGNLAFFLPLFLWSLLLSVTVYSIYVGFGPPSESLRDPFEEHED